MSNHHFSAPDPFRPPRWLSNPHLQTILPKLIAPTAPTYRRVLVKDSLNESEVAYDFYDAFEARSDDRPYQKPLVVLFHGMEGSSDSHYARTLAHHIHAHGWHFVVVHSRSCGGVPAKGKIFYNAGDTAEIQHALSELRKHYQTLFAVGVSLGGNALAKYLGEYETSALCDKAVVVSAPVDLASASVAMERFIGRRIYTPYLLNPIVKKALANQLTPAEFAAIKASRRISEFDHVFTAPRHGFRSKNDYYHQSSALPHMIAIRTPTLVITAKDDPFLGVTATTGDVSNSVQLLDTQYGGHIGFLRWHNRKLDSTWVAQTAVQFFEV